MTAPWRRSCTANNDLLRELLCILDQEPLRTLAQYRRTPAGVIFGQNVIAEGRADLHVGMPVEILE